MFCPECRNKYERGVKTCPTCKMELVPKLDGAYRNEEPKLRAMNPVKLTYVSDHMEAVLLMNLLKNQGVHCYSIDSEAGNYMRLTMGYSVFGEVIYVDKEDYYWAFELINEVSSKIELYDEVECQANDAGDDSAANNYQSTNHDEIDDSEYHIPFYRKPQIIVRITLLVIFGGWIFKFIMNLRYHF